MHGNRVRWRTVMCIVIGFGLRAVMCTVIGSGGGLLYAW